jgi:molecular chaperone GrpE
MSDHKRDEGRENIELENGPNTHGDDGDDKKENISGEFTPSNAEEIDDVSNKKTLSEGSMSSDEVMPEERVSPEIRVLRDEIGEKRKQYHELYDKYVRLVADFENYKKRVSKEKTDIMAYGNEELIKELLGVVDNLERAIKHAESAGETDSITEGVKLVYRQFLNSLEKFGVKPITVTKGDKFDPRHHQAVEYVISNEITPGLIVSQILKGYTLRDKLLRPSLVVVSKAEGKVQEKGNLEKVGGADVEGEASNTDLNETPDDKKSE